MFATLIIKNIGKLYTCDEFFTIYHHAFIAMYHDQIIDLGEHDYHHLIDSSTTMIDAASHAVIPGFIDPDFSIPSQFSWQEQRKIEEKLSYLGLNGTLTVCSDTEYKNLDPIRMDVIHVNSLKPSFNNIKKFKRRMRLLISHQDTILSQHTMASFLYHTKQENEKMLLKAMTSNVAKAYKIKDRGVLKKGNIGDLLVLNTKDIQEFYSTMGKPLYAKIIKKGIPVYPELRRA